MWNSEINTAGDGPLGHTLNAPVSVVNVSRVDGSEV